MEYIEYISEYASEYASNLRNYISSLFYDDQNLGIENLGIDISCSNDIINNYSTYNYRPKYNSTPCKKRFFKKDVEKEIRQKKFDEDYLELEKRFNKLKEDIEYGDVDDDDKNHPDDALRCSLKTKKKLLSI